MELIIDRDPGLCLVKLFPMKRNTAINVGIKVHLAEAWGITP